MNETKQRHGCVIAWLWVATISNVYMAIYYAVTMFSAYSPEITLGLGIQAILSIANVLGAILLMRWNKTGFYLFLMSSLIVCIVNISVFSIRPIVTIGSIFAILIWWAILHIKKNKKTVWSQLEIGWDLKHCRHLYQVFSIICIVCFILMLIAVSLENNTLSNNSSFEEDTVGIVEKVDVLDSVPITKEDKIAEEIEPDIIPAGYYSKDLQTYKLHGNVKKVSYYYISQPGDESFREELIFNKSGKQSFDCKDIKIIRSNDGRISEIEYDFGGRRFTYDSKGETISVIDWDTSTTVEKYTKLDKYGNPIESNQYGEDGEKGCVTGQYKYQYLNWDSQGNWTLRQVYYSDTYDSQWNSSYKQRRDIEYY